MAVMTISILTDRCPTDQQQVAVIESGSSRQARFSALFLPIHGEYSDIYLHCSVSLCDQRSSRCAPVRHTFPIIISMINQ